MKKYYIIPAVSVHSVIPAQLLSGSDKINAVDKVVDDENTIGAKGSFGDFDDEECEEWE